MHAEKMMVSFEEDSVVVNALDDLARAEGVERSVLLRRATRDLLAQRKPEFVIPPFPKARLGRPRKVAQ
jgi:metal-responsive CopG/Arc/MetJ family transcriptional regulator